MNKKLHNIYIITIWIFMTFLVSIQNKECLLANNYNDKHILRYRIENRDTVYYDRLPPVWVFAHDMNKRDWRKYRRLVYNFARVYPLSKMAERLVYRADSTFATKAYSNAEKRHYIRQLQKELLSEYKSTVKQMTISQGVLLVKLVDREVGRSSYTLIKDYRNGLAAGFWQGIAKLFGQNLKREYDPYGEDAPTEDLIKKWQTGEFPHFYYSMFWEYPPQVRIPSKWR